MAERVLPGTLGKYSFGFGRDHLKGYKAPATFLYQFILENSF